MIEVLRILIHPKISINDSPKPKKRAYYIPDTLPSDIYVASSKYFIALTDPSDSPQYILLTYDDPNTYNTIVRDKHGCGMVKGG